MKRTALPILYLLLLALLAAGCASAPKSAVPQTGANVKEVKITNFAFDPSSLSVPVGTTVKWTNQDPSEHTVTADDKSFDSGQLSQGKSFSFTFTQAGTFTYKCSNHPSMHGTITVTK